MSDVVEKPRVRVPAGSSRVEFFQGNRNPLLVSWQPQLRETSIDIMNGWDLAASRAVESIQNSGFLAGVMEVASGGVVGPGLQMSARPNSEALGWSIEFTSEWSRDVEARFRAWCRTPYECDAAGQMTFGQMQQAAFASYMTFGEVFGLLPMLRRPGATSRLKVMLLPPSRLVNETAFHENLIQGVKIDAWGLPLAYKIRRPDPSLGTSTLTVRARDGDGRPNVLHFKDPQIASPRGISPLAPVLKVIRQVDQYADATLTSALIQTIFAATIKTNINGLAAFDGLMTNGDAGSLDVEKYAQTVGDWYDGSKIDLTQHGRIAHMFPNDELEFLEAKQPGQQYDHFMGWLLREITRGAGVTYEAGTGDYRGATYSSVRMASAIEWQTVSRRRGNILEPFCSTVYEAWLEEEIGTGRIQYPGGLQKYYEQRAFASKSSWTGPPKPQADDFKTARAYQVRMEMGATTLAEIAEEYGRDWDDQMRQHKAENDLADKLGLPRPWSPKDILETEKGQAIALKDPGSDGERKDRSAPRRQGAGRPPAERDPAEREPENSADDESEAELQGGLNLGD